jgi:ferredoxin
MADITDIMGLLEKLQSTYITVNQERCAVVRNRHATCRKCADACTSGCISYRENELAIEPEKCIGCGTCATVCPTCALESHNPTDAELFSATLHAMHATNGTAVIACQNVLKKVSGLYDPKKVSEVVCLGRVDESLIALMALAQGREVVLVCGDCAACEHKVGIGTAKLVCETANKLLDVWNSPLRARISNRFPSSVRRVKDANAKGFNEERRAFLRDMKDEAAVITGAAVEQGMESALGTGSDAPRGPEPHIEKVTTAGVLPQHVPTRRKRLLKTLSEMGEPRDEMVATRLWGHVVIDTHKCTSCQMCATFCPTGALTRYKADDGTVGIEHYAGCCVKCRTCTDICPADALTVYDEVFAMDLMHGGIERYPMKPPESFEGGVHQIRSTISKMATLSHVADN